MPGCKQSKTKARTLDVVAKKGSGVSSLKPNIASRCKAHAHCPAALAEDTATWTRVGVSGDSRRSVHQSRHNTSLLFPPPDGRLPGGLFFQPLSRGACPSKELRAAVGHVFRGPDAPILVINLNAFNYSTVRTPTRTLGSADGGSFHRNAGPRDQELAQCGFSRVTFLLGNVQSRGIDGWSSPHSPRLLLCVFERQLGFFFQMRSNTKTTATTQTWISSKTCLQAPVELVHGTTLFQNIQTSVTHWGPGEEGSDLQRNPEAAQGGAGV